MAYTTRLVELTGIDGKVSKLLRLEPIEKKIKKTKPTKTPWKKYMSAPYECPCGLKFFYIVDQKVEINGEMKDVIGIKSHREQRKH